MKRKKTAQPKYRSEAAFTKGKSAYSRNQPLGANPYQQGQVSAYAWQKGWLAGMREHR